MAAPDGCDGKERASRPRAETLNYLCEIIGELKHLADRSGQPTLSAILTAALTEARIQHDDQRCDG
jgi:hypothetical protein